LVGATLRSAMHVLYYVNDMSVVNHGSIFILLVGTYFLKHLAKVS